MQIVSSEQFIKDNNLGGLLFDASPYPKWVCNPAEGRVMCVNAAAAEEFGFAQHEFGQLDPKEFCLRQGLKQNDAADKTVSGISSFSIYKRKNGSIFYAKTVQRALGEAGKYQLTCLADITEAIFYDLGTSSIDRNDIVASITKLRLARASDEYLWLRHADSDTMLYSNGACEQLFGYTEEAFYADGHRLFWSMVHPEDKGLVQASIKELKEGKTDRVMHRFRIQHLNGTTRTIESTVFLDKGRAGTPDCLLGLSRDVTDLVNAHAEFRDKSLELDSMLNSINDSYFKLDHAWKYTYVNAAYVALTGKGYGELVGQCIWEVFPNLKQMQAYKAYYTARAENKVVKFEDYSALLDAWMSVRAFPTDTGLTVCITNITEQKKLMQAIEEKEYNLKALINNTEDFIFSVDLDHQIISVNRACDHLAMDTNGLALSAGDKIVSPGWASSGKDAEWEGDLRAALNGKQVMRTKKVGGGSHPRFIEYNLTPLKDSRGVITGASCFGRDVTSQVLLYDKIARDDANLKAMINNTRDVIFSVDKDYRLIAANDPFKKFLLKMIGKVPELGEPLENNKWPAEVVVQWKSFAERGFRGESFSVTEESLNRDRIAYIEIKVNPIYSDEAIIGVNCFIRDITEQKLATDKMQSQNEKLKEIAWIQSHGMRAKVATILGLGQLFNSEAIDDPINKFVVENLIQTTRELDVIIRDINQKTQTVPI